MFRKLRKWYFKIYHLLRFLGLFILIFGIQKNVYALEYNECFNDYLSNINYPNSSQYCHYEATTDSWSCAGRNWISQNELYEFKENNMFLTYFREPFIQVSRVNQFSLRYMYLYDKDKKLIKTIENTNYDLNQTYEDIDFEYDKDNNIIHFTKKNDEIKYISIVHTIYAYYTPFWTNQSMDFKFTVTPFSTLTCPTTPETPTPGENNVYSNFLTLYTNKLNYLANGFTENPYLIAMIGIIFTWVVLELFLKILHLKGGYHK